MRSFKFRAQAAIQVRRREHDQALVRLAQAQAALEVAERSLEEADRALNEADNHLRAAMQAPVSQAPLEWYRSWRVRRSGEWQQCERFCRAREIDVEQATMHVNTTRLRVRSLERLHEIALVSWRREAHLDDQKTMDALAALRFTRRGKDSV